MVINNGGYGRLVNMTIVGSCLLVTENNISMNWYSQFYKAVLYSKGHLF